MSTCRLPQKNLSSHHLLLFICSHKRRFAIITDTNRTVQNCKGESIIKEINKHQMTIISKEIISIIIIILNNPLVQHTLNNYSHQLFHNSNQSCSIWYMLLTLTLKCNVVPFTRKYPKRVHTTLLLRKTRQHVSRSPYRAQATSPWWSAWATREFQTEWHAPKYKYFPSLKSTSTYRLSLYYFHAIWSMKHRHHQCTNHG